LKARNRQYDMTLSVQCSKSPRRFVRHGLTGLIILTATTLSGINSVGNAIANGDTRALTIQHMHTQEAATITYKVNGQFNRAGLDKLNWMLRDWRRDEPINMDPRLFDVVWEAVQSTGSSNPVHVVSGYRSPTTNAMLRRRSNMVAKNSQHMLGKAMDFYLTDVGMDKVRDVGLRMQRGGVGYYPTSYTPFVHLDVGNVRHWPRMTHDQLARVFPDGKTVHIGTDGKPFPRYDEAYAEVIAAGGSVGGYAGDGEESAAVADSGATGGFFAWLFGRSNDEDSSAKPARGTTARRGGTSQPQMASLNTDDASPVAALLQYEQAQKNANAPQRPRGQIVSAPTQAAAPEEEAPAPRLPAVAQAELRPITQPLNRVSAPLPNQPVQQLAWITGPAPLPPQARGNAAPITIVAVFSSLSHYKRVNVPLPPEGRASVSVMAKASPGIQASPAPLQVAALAPSKVSNLAQYPLAHVPVPQPRPDGKSRLAEADPVATGSLRQAYPPAITGRKTAYDAPNPAYMPVQTARADEAPTNGFRSAPVSGSNGFNLR
jgi:uncharacterized protein YcbK (DUF882 family)